MAADRFSKMRAVANAVSKIEKIEDLEWIRKAVDDEIAGRLEARSDDTADRASATTEDLGL